MTVAGASGFSAALPEAAAEEVGAEPDEDEELEPLPPHAAASSAAAASSGASAAVRRVRKRIAFGMSAIVFPSPPPRAVLVRDLYESDRIPMGVARQP